jgi:O-methyltransferase.
MRYISNFIVSALLLPLCLSAEDREQFKKWWGDYPKKDEALPKELVQMVDYYVSSPTLLNETTEYWSRLNLFSIQQLENGGYQDFKNNITKNYFQWVTSLSHLHASKLRSIVKKKIVALSRDEYDRVQPGLSYKESAQFNKVTELFINYVYKLKQQEVLDRLEEPLIGNPCYVMFRGKRVSQDILNSVLELSSIQKGCDLAGVKRIYEVGAGSGRTAYAILNLFPETKYVIVDLPPALYISQTYLSEVFPEKRVMKFRDFKEFEEVAEEYYASDIVFMTPDQLRTLPRSDDESLFVAINCFSELSGESAQAYLKEADRLSRYVYIKGAKIGDDEKDDHSRAPEHWVRRLKNNHSIFTESYEAFYTTKKE